VIADIDDHSNQSNHSIDDQDFEEKPVMILTRMQTTIEKDVYYFPVNDTNPLAIDRA